jgi:hypothetical protein
MACENYHENNEVVQNSNSNLEKQKGDKYENDGDLEKIRNDCADKRGSGEGVEVKDITSGRPVSLLSTIGLSDLLEKWPAVCVPMGGRVGFLTAGTYVRASVCTRTSMYMYMYTYTNTHTHTQSR